MGGWIYGEWGHQKRRSDGPQRTDLGVGGAGVGVESCGLTRFAADLVSLRAADY